MHKLCCQNSTIFPPACISWPNKAALQNFLVLYLQVIMALVTRVSMKRMEKVTLGCSYNAVNI